jgi:hypothetical protein
MEIWSIGRVVIKAVAWNHWGFEFNSWATQKTEKKRKFFPLNVHGRSSSNDRVGSPKKTENSRLELEITKITATGSILRTEVDVWCMVVWQVDEKRLSPWVNRSFQTNFKFAVIINCVLRHASGATTAEEWWTLLMFELWKKVQRCTVRTFSVSEIADREYARSHYVQIIESETADQICFDLSFATCCKLQKIPEMTSSLISKSTL